MKNLGKKEKRKRKVRAKILKRKDHLRLSVFRSNKYIYGQIIDDLKEITLLSAGEKDLRLPSRQKSQEIPEGRLRVNKIEKAKMIGKILAEKALKKEIKEVVFDRGSYQFRGRVKALAEGAREGGLKF